MVLSFVNYELVRPSLLPYYRIKFIFKILHVFPCCCFKLFIESSEVTEELQARVTDLLLPHLENLPPWSVQRATSPVRAIAKYACAEAVRRISV